MECPDRKLLIRYEHGVLEESEGVQLDRHVRQCGACASTMQAIREQDKDRRFFRTALAGAALTAVDKTVGRPDAGTGGDSAGTSAFMAVQQYMEHKQGGTADPSSSGTAWAIADYDRVALCGEGSYGSVWAVRDRVGVYRALKLIDLDRLERAGVTCHEISALENYCRKVSRHPYLITVYHVGVVGRWLYYTMELADDQQRPGGLREPFPADYRPLTLATLIKGKRLKVDVAVEIARRLLRGLAKLHELDLVHRDVKPSNIVFVNRYPKLADIGILTVEQGPAKVVGTPKYMPPDRAIDKTADVYAMGIVLREMIEGGTGAGDNEYAEPTRWDMERLYAVITRACADESDERYPSAAAMLEDLETCRYEGSVFNEVAEMFPAATPPKQSVGIQLAFAFAHRIPWIVGGIIVIYFLSRII